jgi:hypothetical protein
LRPDWGKIRKTPSQPVVLPVVLTCGPSYTESANRRIMVQISPGKKIKAKRARFVAQVAEHLLRKYGALSLNPSTVKIIIIIIIIIIHLHFKYYPL